VITLGSKLLKIKYLDKTSTII